MLLLDDSPPEALTGATRPSEPEITAALAFAGAWAGAAETSVAAATTTATAAPRSRMRTFRVCQTYLAETCR